MEGWCWLSLLEQNIFLNCSSFYLEKNPAAGTGWMFVDFIVMQRVNDFGTAILTLLRPTKLLISLINIDILI
jgi:hypothetical protein